jgi:hypothetical protein
LRQKGCACLADILLRDLFVHLRLPVKRGVPKRKLNGLLDRHGTMRSRRTAERVIVVRRMHSPLAMTLLHPRLAGRRRRRVWRARRVHSPMRVSGLRWLLRLLLRIRLTCQARQTKEQQEKV